MKRLCVCGDPVQFIAGPYRVGFCSVPCIPISWRPVKLRAVKYRTSRDFESRVVRKPDQGASR